MLWPSSAVPSNARQSQRSGGSAFSRTKRRICRFRGARWRTAASASIAISPTGAAVGVVQRIGECSDGAPDWNGAVSVAGALVTRLRCNDCGRRLGSAYESGDCKLGEVRRASAAR